MMLIKRGMNYEGKCVIILERVYIALIPILNGLVSPGIFHWLYL
jgi:hypothetical protein